MRILQVTTGDNLGYQFNGYQIHKGCQKLGHQSDMAVLHSRFNDNRIHQIGNRVTRRLDSHILVPLENYLSLDSILPISGSTLFLRYYYRKADIVHLQLVYSVQFFSLLNLPVMSRDHRLVWTIHDPWLLTGHCVYPLECNRWQSGCGNCPDLNLTRRIKRDNTAFLWKVKHWVMHHSDVTLIVASQWMNDLIKSSPILSHLPCHIIPFGVDLQRFQPHDSVKSRSRFGIPKDANVLAFRYRGENERFKGWPWLKKSLKLLNLNKPTYLIVFEGKGGMAELYDKYNIVELGWVNDEDLLIDALNAADIFLMPSVAEAFGMMAVEAMACGTPVVGFDGTALSGVVHAPRAGIMVSQKDSAVLAETIQNLLQNQALNESLIREGLKIVQQEYNVELYVQRHIALYESLIKSPRSL